MSERMALYRVFTADDALLYVGISKSFGKRWTQHMAAQPWWPEAHHQTVYWYPDRDAASNAETAAIKAEKPRHNIVHTPRQHRNARPLTAITGLGAYVGAAEIGRMLGGLSRQRVQQLISREDFPAPEVVLNMGKVWKRADVEAWAREDGRSPAAE